MPRSIRLPFIPDAVETLTLLDENNFKALVDWVRNKHGIELSDSRLTTLSKEVGLKSKKQTRSLFVFLKFAYQNVFANEGKLDLKSRLHSYV